MRYFEDWLKEDRKEPKIRFPSLIKEMLNFTSKINNMPTNYAVKIKLLDGVELPEYKTAGAAGFDLKIYSFKKLFKGKKEINLDKECREAISNGFIMLRPFERVLCGTGMFMEIPKGKELQIRSRSGLTLTDGIVVLNAPGTIDCDYRGEVCIILYNSTQFLAKVHIGDRVAQAILSDYFQTGFEVVDSVEATERSVEGFGSTGRN